MIISALLTLTFSFSSFAKCNYADVFQLHEQLENPHSARAIASELKIENLRRDILALSGQIRIDEGEALLDRAELGNRGRVRKFLRARIEGLGLKYNDEISHDSIVNRRIGYPIDLASASPDFLVYLWTTRYLSQVVTFLKRHTDLQQPEDLKTKLNYELLEEIHRFLRQRAKTRFSHLDLDPVLKELGLDKQVMLSELNHFMDSLHEGSLVKNQTVTDEPAVMNLIGEIEGSEHPDEVIEVMAHYDSFMTRGPGADDNGSGVSLMLEMMRVFKLHPPKRTLRFIFTDLEERGMVGASQHVRHLMQDKQHKLMGALVLDTLGYAPLTDSAPVFVLELGLQKRRTARGYARARQFADVLAWQFARYERMVQMSTETEFAMTSTAEHGQYITYDLPGLLAAAPYEGEFINPGYHTQDDKIRWINWGFFAENAGAIIEGVAAATGALASHDALKRIAPEAMQAFAELYTAVLPDQSHQKTIDF